MTYLIITSLILAFAYAFINGFHDGCNVFATAVASNSVNPRKALLLAFSAELTVPLFAGTAVATTIGKGVLSNDIMQKIGQPYSLMMVISALAAAIIWNLATWRFGLPSSSSHALIGGLIGAGLVSYGPGIIVAGTLINKVILALLLTPIIGFIAGFLFIKMTKLLLSRLNPRLGFLIKKLHTLSILFMAGSHGTADAQKTMGISALILLLAGGAGMSDMPFWIKLCSAASLAAGLLFGSRKILRTVGRGIYKLEPIHSLNAQAASAAVILGSSLLGGAVSTSQIMSSTVAGVGSGERYNAVNWKNVESIFYSWILTIPMSAIIAALLYLLLKLSSY